MDAGRDPDGPKSQFHSDAIGNWKCETETDGKQETTDSTRSMHRSKEIENLKLNFIAPNYGARIPASPPPTPPIKSIH